MKTIITSNNKKIHIFDGLYDFDSRSKYYSYVNNSLFSTTGGDSDRLEHRGGYNICSVYNEKDLSAFGILDNPASQQFLKFLEGAQIAQVRVNLSTLFDQNRFHVDLYTGEGSITMLYYPNMEWSMEAGGHTLFANENVTEMEYCAQYVPGRVILFDGTIPHCIMAPNTLSPSYRFSVAIQFKGKLL